MERSDKPISDLVRDLVGQVSSLIRHEIQLARAEMGEKASQAESGITMLAFALVLGLGAVVILLFGAVDALSMKMAPWLAALIVGGVTALVALILLAKGKSNLKARNLMPTRTIDSMRDDARYAQGRT